MKKILPVLLTLIVLNFLVFNSPVAAKPVDRLLSDPQQQINQSMAPKILLFIGDGMGLEQRKAAQWSSKGLDEPLIMDQLPYSGWSQTASADNLITDSAAGATAIATGYPTNNGMIAISPEFANLKTILEYAQERGMATGLVTTVQISHATPASFGSHVINRGQMTDIAQQLLEHKINVILGGGEDEFLPITDNGCFTQPGERDDERNLIQEAQAAGYTYVCTSEDLALVNIAETTHLLGLFGDEEMLHPITPTLATMTQTAIDILSLDPDGFFLMVEGGQIDWFCHANDAANAIQETIDLDAAVQIGRSFQTTVENTLLIVTADHETGGMKVHLSTTGEPDEDGPFFTPQGIPFYVTWDTNGHTAADIPLTALGSGAEQAQGIFPNTQLFWIMADLIFPRLYLPLLFK